MHEYSQKELLCEKRICLLHERHKLTICFKQKTFPLLEILLLMTPNMFEILSLFHQKCCFKTNMFSTNYCKRTATWKFACHPAFCDQMGVIWKNSGNQKNQCHFHLFSPMFEKLKLLPFPTLPLLFYVPMTNIRQTKPKFQLHHPFSPSLSLLWVQVQILFQHLYPKAW